MKKSQKILLARKCPCCGHPYEAICTCEYETDVVDGHVIFCAFVEAVDDKTGEPITDEDELTRLEISLAATVDDFITDRI